MKKFLCQNDECEQPHCKECGHHYDPACGVGGVCDSCLIERRMCQAQAEAAAFGDNYEEANRYFHPGE